MERAFELNWNGCSIWIGITVRFRLESLFDLRWNVQPSVTRVLETAGLAYKHKAWMRSKGEVLQVFSLDRSPYGELLQPECGVFVIACPGTDPPIWNHAHLRRRTKVEQGSRLDQLLESPSSISDADAYEILTLELLPKIEAFFAHLDTIEKVEAVARKRNPNEIATVTRTIIKWFKVPIPDSPEIAQITVNGTIALS